MSDFVKKLLRSASGNNYDVVSIHKLGCSAV